jgi:peptidoglycan/xylan/chitin deacetylase (PgdA/CDA1 family)
MTWEDIDSLQNAGHDIQSHGMSHIDLRNVPQNDLDYEIGQFKQCLLDHNINSTVFANAFSTGRDNSTIINTIAKYYDMARNDYATLTYLKCNEWKDVSNQTDYRTYFDNSTLTYANRYSIRTGDHNYLDRTYRHNSSKILEDFIEIVNS